MAQSDVDLFGGEEERATSPEIPCQSHRHEKFPSLEVFYGSTFTRSGFSAYPDVPSTNKTPMGKEKPSSSQGVASSIQTPHNSGNSKEPVTSHSSTSSHSCSSENQTQTPSRRGITKHNQQFTQSSSSDDLREPRWYKDLYSNPPKKGYIRKRHIYPSSSDEASEYEEETTRRKANSKRTRHVSEQGTIQESLHEVKDMLQMLCEKVEKNEKCLKELQNIQHSKSMDFAIIQVSAQPTMLLTVE